MNIMINKNNMKKNKFTLEAKIWNEKRWIKETDPDKLRNKFSDLLYDSGFSVLNFQEHYFKPQGYTALWLLGESHFAIHTFPESNKSYIELSSCNEAKHIYFINNI